MRRYAWYWPVLVVLVLGAASAAAAASAATPPAFGGRFNLVGDFPLGAATSRTDYESIDPAPRRIYITEMGAGKLLVFDIAANRLVARLAGFPKVTGVLVVPELHKVYASVPGAGLLPSLSQALGMVGLSRGRGAIAVVDTATLREIARLPGGVFPDGIAYDPKDRRIFVSDELGSAITVIDADKNRVLARIRPGGAVGNVQYDATTRRVYAPLQSRDELAVIDPASAHLLGRYPLPGARHPHGLAIAPGGGVGYVACDGNDRLLTVD
ncbi:MAG TPA: YncE family protein, partial [Stellaceae bacterium]|nr:YncE family protein [Stellaceae bacterium]